MEIKQFAEIIKEELERTGKDVKVHEVRKNNNVVLQGVSIREPGSSIALTVYIEHYFEDYQNGRRIDSIVAAILKVVQDDKMDKLMDMNWFRDFEQVRDKVAFKLINYEANRELLNEVPYTRYLDLAKVYYVVVEAECFGSGTILIHNSHLDMWGVSSEQLGAVADENTPKMLPVEIGSICEVIKSLVKDEDILLECIDAFGDYQMYVASNPIKTFGAAVLCYPNVIKDFAERLESDLFILPSSTHEIIIVLQKEMVVTALKEMVYEVNRTQVAAEEVLSDSVYYYSRETNTLSIA